MMTQRLIALLAAAVLGAGAYAPDDAAAQQPRRPAPAAAATSGAPGATSAFSGFQQNNKEPISIESLSLEVRDKEKMATFIDNVKLVQGDTMLECRRLIVYYDEEPAPASAGKSAPRSSLVSAAPEGGQQIRRLEAKGGVVVTQKDQIATGDNAVYEMKTNSIVLTGNVVMTQGQNVVKGDKLFVDMATGISRVESGTGGQRGPVRALFNPSSARPAPGAATPPAATAPPAGGRSATGSVDRGGNDRDKPGAAAEREAQRGSAPRPLKLN